MEEVNTGESWNKKRIIIAVFLLVLLLAAGYLFKTRILSQDSVRQVKSVKGISAEENIVKSEPKIDIQEALKEKIDNLKQQVSGLDVADIASSSPQVQKILNDIKSLEQYPTNQIKDICRKICGL